MYSLIETYSEHGVDGRETTQLKYLKWLVAVSGIKHSLCCRSWRVFAPERWCIYDCVWLRRVFLMLWQYGFSYTSTRTTTCPLAHRKTHAGSRPSIQYRVHSVRTTVYSCKNIGNNRVKLLFEWEKIYSGTSFCPSEHVLLSEGGENVFD